jgi:Leucine-rich repeat (LRR) protein
LEKLPLPIGQLNALQKLDLSECANLKELPSSIGQLNALQELDLNGCDNLKKLPSSIGKLNALKKLDLKGWSQHNYLHVLTNGMQSKSLICFCVRT